MPRFFRRPLAFALLACVSIVAAASPTPASNVAPAPVTVFAAASMKESLDAAAGVFEQRTGTRVRVSYAASSALARQIEQGAPADVFLSADRDWMDHLGERRLLRAGTRRDLLASALVLVAPRDARLPRVSLKQPDSVIRALGDGRLALALTASVPAGRYAKVGFESLGLWTQLRPRVVETENVRAALLLVARSEARMGAVYATDARAEPRVRVLAAFPARSHPPIVYPVAVIAASRHPRATDFANWLRSNDARAIFERHGFVAIR